MAVYEEVWKEERNGDIKMTRIPITRSRDANYQANSKGLHVLEMTTVEATYIPGSGAVIPLIFENDRNDFQSFCLKLSPPTAMQLSRALRRAVKDYLNYSPETGSHSTDNQS